MGAIATPFVVISLTTTAPDSWRLPFRVIGAAGAVWVIVWLAVVRSEDLDMTNASLADDTGSALIPSLSEDLSRSRIVFVRRFLALVVVVVVINLCWQFFRAWMPKMLREEYQYSLFQVQYFSVAYYVAADVGCLGVGFLVKWLASKGYSIHGARMATFSVCVFLTALSTLAALLPASVFLLTTLLLIGFGSLGQFPVYYALTQELSARRMGNITGILSFLFGFPIGWFLARLVSGSTARLLFSVVQFAGRFCR